MKLYARSRTFSSPHTNTTRMILSSSHEAKPFPRKKCVAHTMLWQRSYNVNTEHNCITSKKESGTVAKLVMLRVSYFGKTFDRVQSTSINDAEEGSASVRGRRCCSLRFFHTPWLHTPLCRKPTDSSEDSLGTFTFHLERMDLLSLLSPVYLDGRSTLYRKAQCLL